MNPNTSQIKYSWIECDLTLCLCAVDSIRTRDCGHECYQFNLLVLYDQTQMAYSCEMTMWVQNLLLVAADKNRPDVAIADTIEVLNHGVELRLL